MNTVDNNNYNNNNDDGAWVLSSPYESTGSGDLKSSSVKVSANYRFMCREDK